MIAVVCVYTSVTGVLRRHIVSAEALDGKVIDWMESVTDEAYWLPQ